jgi:hypothetical protein
MDNSIGIVRLDDYRVGIETREVRRRCDRFPKDGALVVLNADEQSMEGMDDHASIPSFTPNAIPRKGFAIHQSMEFVCILGEQSIGLTEYPHPEGTPADPTDADGSEPNKKRDDDRGASAEHQLLPKWNQWRSLRMPALLDGEQRIGALRVEYSASVIGVEEGF